MKYNELFDLEMQLANSGIKTEQYNCEEGAPLSELIGETKYGVWDSYIAKGFWIVITYQYGYEAKNTFRNLLEKFPKLPNENALWLIQNKDEEYKIVIQVNETKF